MAYPHVPKNELRLVAQRMLQKGLPEDKLEEALRSYATEREYSYFSEESYKGPLALGLKSTVANIVPTVGMWLAGTGRRARPSKLQEEGRRLIAGEREEEVSYQPSSLQQAIIDAGERLTRSNPFPLWAKESDEVITGNVEGVGKTGQAFALAGRTLPIMGLSQLASIPGRILGGVPGSMVTGSQPMIAMETQGFASAVDGIGFDPDLVKKYSDMYGSLSGIVEYAQVVGLLLPWKKLRQKIIKKGLLVALSVGAAKELAASGFEGVEELTQAHIFNKVLERMTAEQNSRNIKKGLEILDPRTLDNLKQDISQSFWQGFGASLIIRGPATTMNVGRTVGDVKFEGYLNRMGKEVLEAAKKDIPIEVVLKAVVPDAPSTTSPGTAQQKLAEFHKATPEEVMEKLNNLDLRGKDIEAVQLDPATGKKVTTRHHVVGLNEVAKAYDIKMEDQNGIPKDRAQIIQEIGQASGAITEGPQYTVERGKDGKFRGVVKVVSPVLNPVTPSQKGRAGKLESILKGFAKGLRTPKAIALDNLDTAIKRNEPKAIKQYMTELAQLGMDIKAIQEAVRAMKAGEPYAGGPDSLYTVEPFIGTEKARGIVDSTMYRALAPVVGEDTANALMKMFKVSFQTGKEGYTTQELSQVLTRQQFAEFSQNLEGEVRESVRILEGRKAAERLTVDLDSAWSVANVVTPEGTKINIKEIQDPPQFNFLLPHRALLPALEWISQKLNLPQIMEMDHSVFKGHKYALKMMVALRAGTKAVFQQLPRPLRVGLPGEKFADLVHFLMTDPDARVELSKVLGLKNNATAYIEEVVNASSMKDRDQIITHAKETAKLMRTMFNWFASNGAITPHQFRQRYVPVYRMYMAETGGEKISLDSWVSKNKDLLRAEHGLSNRDMEGLVDFADSLSYWRRRGMITPGETTPFFQYARSDTKSFLKDMTMLTDIRDIADLYIRRMSTKLTFDHMVPAIQSIIQQAHNRLEGMPNATESKKYLDSVFNNYFESILGTPDNAARFLMSKQAPFKSTSRFLTVGLNKALDFYNKNPLTKHFPRFEKISTDPSMNYNDLLNMTVTMMYGYTLGMPMNIVAPIKNLTQSYLGITAVGFPTWFRGLTLLAGGVKGTLMREDNTIFNELKELNLRPEFPMMDQLESAGRKGRWNLVAKLALGPYRLSDLYNVYATAASGLVAWRRIESTLKNDPTGKTLTDKQIVGNLFEGGVPKVDTKQVMQNPMQNDIKWKKVISKPIAQAVTEMIRRGEADNAKELYTQYLVNLSQWRYGPGGRPGLLRNSAVRAALMYYSWPINYIDFLHNSFRLSHSGLYMRNAMSIGLGVITTSLLSMAGLSTWKWLLFGPLPDDFVPNTPLVQLMRSLVGAAVGTTKTAQAYMLPWVPDEEREKQWEVTKKELEALVPEVDFIDTRVLDFLGHED